MAQAAFVILGGGPVALACALWCARQGQVRVLMAPAERRCALPPRIEAVPMRVVAGLVALGVQPHAVGVVEFVDRRLLAWEHAKPMAAQAPAAAHLERPALDHALLALAGRHPGIELCRMQPAAAGAEAATLAGSGVCVIDATGRRAVLAARTVRPRRPWVARMFHVPCGAAQAGAAFMAAALPQGYVYRVAGQHCSTVGFVGCSDVLSGSAAALRERLRDHAAGWLIDDIAGRAWTPAGAGAASLQWAEGGGAALIGDAALARDALSSQGLAGGLTDARYAAAITSEADRQALAQRSRLARAAHASELAHLIDTCRWREQPVWREYRRFLVEAGAATQSA